MWIAYVLLLAVGVLLVAAFVLALCASAMIGRPLSEREQRVTILCAGDQIDRKCTSSSRTVLHVFRRV